MPLSKLSITNFRCFESLELSLSPGVNFFYGSNGSGKTSLLEAIYLFSSGKSFKSTNLAALIKHNNNKLMATRLRSYTTVRRCELRATPSTGLQERDHHDWLGCGRESQTGASNINTARLIQTTRSHIIGLSRGWRMGGCGC